MTAQPFTELPADRVLKTVRTYRQGPVLTVELNVPEEGNAVGDAMLDDLLTVLDDQDPDVRVLVLAAAGEEFCLGGDRREFPGTWTTTPPAAAYASPARRRCGCARP